MVSKLEFHFLGSGKYENVAKKSRNLFLYVILYGYITTVNWMAEQEFRSCMFENSRCSFSQGILFT